MYYIGLDNVLLFVWKVPARGPFGIGFVVVGLSRTLG